MTAIALSKAKVIAILKFNPQQNGDRTFKRQNDRTFINSTYKTAIAPSKAKAIATSTFNQQNNSVAEGTAKQTALSQAKTIAILKFNQQDDGVAEGAARCRPHLNYKIGDRALKVIG